MTLEKGSVTFTTPKRAASSSVPFYPFTPNPVTRIASDQC